MQHLSNEHRLKIKSQAIEIKQKKLTDIFINHDKGDKTSAESKNLDEKFVLARRVILWYCKDLMPFNSVQNHGFTDFWQAINCNIQLPSRSTLSMSALDDMYFCMKAELLKILNASSEHSTITFDMWSDNQKHISYITYTYHYISHDWIMKSTVLKTSMFEHPHTAERIRDNFESMMQEYKIAEKNIVCITDGGTNVKKCVELLNLKRFGCIAHSANRLIQHDLMKNDDVKPISDLIVKLRKIQKSLLYKYQEMKNIHEDDRQKQMYALLEEFAETDDIFEAEYQFNSDVLGNSSFSGLKSISNIRWNCILKVAKCHLEHSGI